MADTDGDTIDDAIDNDDDNDGILDTTEFQLDTPNWTASQQQNLATTPFAADLGGSSIDFSADLTGDSTDTLSTTFSLNGAFSADSGMAIVAGDLLLLRIRHHHPHQFPGCG